MTDAPVLDINIEQFSKLAQSIESEVGRVIVGQKDVGVSPARSWSLRTAGNGDGEHEETRETLPPAHIRD